MRYSKVLVKFIFLMFICQSSKATNFYWQAPVCPHSSISVVNFLAYPPEIQISTQSGNLSGQLVKYIAQVLPTCCSSVKLIYSEMNATTSEEVELLIRKDKNSYLSLYFPVFANKKETEHYERPFFGLYNSPGPAVLVPLGKEENRSSFGVTAVKKSWKLLLLAFLMAAGFGILTWALVSLIKLTFYSSNFNIRWYVNSKEGIQIKMTILRKRKNWWPGVSCNTKCWAW